MLSVEIPGRGLYEIEHFVFDYNGTIAEDGEPLASFTKHVEELKKLGSVHVLTADTYGTVREKLAPFDVDIMTFPKGDAEPYKEKIVTELGKGVVAFGNGYNDRAMLDKAMLSIAIIDREGACCELLMHADIVVTSLEDAIMLFLKKDRLRATLRT